MGYSAADFVNDVGDLLILNANENGDLGDTLCLHKISNRFDNLDQDILEDFNERTVPNYARRPPSTPKE